MTDRSRSSNRFSRRDMLKGAAALGLGAAGAAVFPGSDIRVDAIRRSNRRPGKARNQDVRDRRAQDFAAGRAHGAVVSGHGQGASLRGRAGAAFESRAIPTPLAPTHVGLHWKGRGGVPSDLALSVRGSGNGRDWSNWEQTGIEAISSNEHGAIPVHGELTDESLLNQAGIHVFGALVGLNRPAFLQYRVDFQSNQDIDFDEVALACIDAGDNYDESSSAWFATASAQTTDSVALTNVAGVSINVVTREGWGADEDIEFEWEERFVPVKKVFLHHTATSNNYRDGAAEVRAIHSYHGQTLGWGDIGYQMLVDRFGNIYEGRRGRDGGSESGREILSNGVEAGHVYAYNYGTSGIAAIGDSQKGQWDRFWDDTGLNAIVDAVAFECGRHYLNPQGESHFLRSDRVWHNGPLQHCAGHQDADGSGGSTACPGNRLYDFLNNELRTRVAGRLAGAAEPDGMSGTLDGDTLQFDWVGASSEDFSVFFEGWWRRAEESGSVMEYLTGQHVDFAAHDWAATGDSGQSWNGIAHTGSSADFSITDRGQYTLHVRKAGENFAFASHYTVLAEDVQEPDDPVTGSISGTIVDDGGNGLGDVLVEVEGTDLSTSTDVSGNYSLNDVPTGDQTVKASLEGYTTQTQTVQIVEGQNAEVDFTLTLTPPTVSGVVAVEGTDLSEMIQGAAVTLVGLDGSEYTDETETDESGEFSFGEVPTGDYEVTASADGYASETMPITVEDSDVGVILQLQPVEDDGGGGEEPAGPVIDDFTVSSRSTGPWLRVDTSWTVSHADGGLETVTSELLDGSGNVLDSVTSNVSGSSATGEHELRTRDNGAVVRLTVTAAGESTSESLTI